MASGYVITRVWGIPIKLHITLLLVLPFFLIHMTGMGLTLLGAALTIILLFGSVALHELGHSRAAHRYGYRVREILLLPIGGVAMLEQLPKKPIEEFVIAIAGPVVSLILALGAMILMAGSSELGLIQVSQILGIAMIVAAALAQVRRLRNRIPPEAVPDPVVEPGPAREVAPRPEPTPAVRHAPDPTRERLVALVAREKALAAIPVALVFGALRTGSGFVSSTGVEAEITEVIQGFLVLALLVPPAVVFLQDRRAARAMTKART